MTNRRAGTLLCIALRTNWKSATEKLGRAIGFMGELHAATIPTWGLGLDQ